MSSTLIQFRTDDDSKLKATSICERLGIDLPTYMRMSISRLIRENGIPFKKLDEEKESREDNHGECDCDIEKRRGARSEAGRPLDL
ncbi:MAG TPA: type II toxin-antitoxin system RelB/DinJ family antitoxin [Candidatus Mediterraneibacter cottocaccae]|nr:type II toxin-antitoxin system RelB/DinJ family antitoxin [Candidatus Mediterraneibacter cottocaccae]